MVLAIVTGTPAFADFSARTVALGQLAGGDTDLGATLFGLGVTVPSPSRYAPIVGIGAAPGGDRYYWYADGTVSVGSDVDFEATQGRMPYTLPDGKHPWDIIAMAIRGDNSRVVTFYANGEFSVGSSQDLGAYRDPRPFELPPGKRVEDIVGIGCAGSESRFVAFYSNGTFSVGPDGLARRLFVTGQKLSPYQIPPGHKIGQLLDVAIDKSEASPIVSWWLDVEAGSAHQNLQDPVDAMVMDVMQRYSLPGMTVAVSRAGRLLLEKGYGYRNMTDGERANPDSPGRIGSVSKIITTLAAFELVRTADLEVSDRVYGPTGVLSSLSYQQHAIKGMYRHQPVVAKAIDEYDQVVTWYHDGTVSVGTTSDPDAYADPVPYTLAYRSEEDPANPDDQDYMAPVDVRAIAIDEDGLAWTWYDDGTHSVGSITDLDDHWNRNPGVKLRLPAGYAMNHIVAMAIAPEFVDPVRVWFDDGRFSDGDYLHINDLPAFDIGLGSHYSVAPGRSPYEICGIGIAKAGDDAGDTYTFLGRTEDDGNGTVLHGRPDNLDAYQPPAWGVDDSSYEIPGSAYDPDQPWESWYLNMKVKHLLTHTSGFSRSGDVVGAARMFGLDEDGVGMSYQQVNEYMLATENLHFRPGSERSYSNHGFGLVGHIVAEVSGETYYGFTRSRIIDPFPPLHIRSFSEPQEPNDMWRHNYGEDGVPEAFIDDDLHDLGLASGGWKASAGDLVRLMLKIDGNDDNHADILPRSQPVWNPHSQNWESEPILDLMESQAYPAFDQAYGWRIDDWGKLYKDGRLGGGTTFLAKYPGGYGGFPDAFEADEITVAIHTNVSIPDERGGSGVLQVLADRIAIATDRADISLAKFGPYDLF